MARFDLTELTPCGECGMPCKPGEFHPYAACLMFKGCHDSTTVRANLQSLSAGAGASGGGGITAKWVAGYMMAPIRNPEAWPENYANGFNDCAKTCAEQVAYAFAEWEELHSRALASPATGDGPCCAMAGTYACKCNTFTASATPHPESEPIARGKPYKRPDRHVRHVGGGLLALFDGENEVREIGITPGWDFRDRDEFIVRYNAYTNTAAPQPQQESGPVLDRPARIGATVFGVGVPWRLVIDRAQREQEWHENPPLPNADMDGLRKLLATPPAHGDGEGECTLGLLLSADEMKFASEHAHAIIGAPGSWVKLDDAIEYARAARPSPVGDARDAARWRWLIDENNWHHEAWPVFVDPCSTPEEMTAAIDSAMQNASGGRG